MVKIRSSVDDVAMELVISFSQRNRDELLVMMGSLLKRKEEDEELNY